MQDSQRTNLAERAAPYAEVLASLGVETNRVIYEDQSRNTYENAVFSKRLIDPGQSERWLLVTSARHMPRAIGSFRKGMFTGEDAPFGSRFVDMETGHWSIWEAVRRSCTSAMPPAI